MESTLPPTGQGLKILFAASEAVPLIKTGGLADVAGSLPLYLHRLGNDVRVILPAYPQALERAIPVRMVASLRVAGAAEPIRLLEGRLNDEVPVYLVDAPGLFNRRGNPYVDPQGRDWPDNAQRFAVFCRVIVQLALDRAGLRWQPEVLHCNDWQTGLAPALVAQEWNRPATVFTIHNLAYQGLFDRIQFERLQLPRNLWSPQGLEFHDRLSFIKGGLAFADWLTTVSPTYALEIQTPELGYGLEGLLEHRADRLTGVLNGIDNEVWNPASDPLIEQHYDTDSFANKRINKRALQQELGLPANDKALLCGHIGRMVEQKGSDLLRDVVPRLMEHPDVQLAILGHGDPALEKSMLELAGRYPGRVAVSVGIDERLAHRLEAGADVFVMPSRFEPCGLNQLYSLRYGTVPVVHRVGGLADTVVDSNSRNLLDGSATGFVFDRPEAAALLEALERVIEFRRRPPIYWEKLAVTGMRQAFGWEISANFYLAIYQQAMDHPAPSPL
jgi:starch synthase